MAHGKLSLWIQVKMVHYTRGHGILFIVDPLQHFFCPFTDANVGDKSTKAVLAIGEVSSTACIECQKRGPHI